MSLFKVEFGIKPLKSARVMQQFTTSTKLNKYIFVRTLWFLKLATFRSIHGSIGKYTLLAANGVFFFANTFRQREIQNLSRTKWDVKTVSLRGTQSDKHCSYICKSTQSLFILYPVTKRGFRVSVNKLKIRCSNKNTGVQLNIWNLLADKKIISV